MKEEKRMGTILKNPIYWTDIPDVDVIRYKDSFYMVSTTMHVLPGCPIMKSKDLVNWEIQSYIFDTIEDNKIYRLENTTGRFGAYGRGQWATSLRYHDGMFYACFVCNDMKTTYIYYTPDIESGNWKRHTLKGIYHDPSLLFDEGRLFIIYNGGDVKIRELLPDGSGVMPGGISQPLFSTPKERVGLRCEGCHAYKIGEYYYLIFIEWPKDGNQRRREVCYRSKNLLGPYERKVVMDDDMGYRNKGVAQGAIFDDMDGNWYSMLFQDHDAVGRIPCILPVTWEDGWPVFGINGKIPKEWEVPFEEVKTAPMIISDTFNHEKNELALNWQWNHNPDNELWSFTERPGYLRLKTGRFAKDILHARNTLTQRTEGPTCTFTVEADISKMEIGDHAGLIALQSHYGTVGVRKTAKGAQVVMTIHRGDVEVKECKSDANSVFFRIHFDFFNSHDKADFYYSFDGEEYYPIGKQLKMVFTLDHFMGYRIGIFNYATKTKGGYVDFRNFVKGE